MYSFSEDYLTLPHLFEDLLEPVERDFDALHRTLLVGIVLLLDREPLRAPHLVAGGDE